MALGRRRADRQGELWVSADQLPRSIGHVFYGLLSALLLDAGFDRFAENLCAQYYANERGRPSISPGRTSGYSWSDVSRGSNRNASSPGGARIRSRCESFWASRCANSRRMIRHFR
jgi:hypothetical protein